MTKKFSGRQAVTVAAVFLLLVCVPMAFAQKDSPTRSVEGAVTNPDEGSVTGAVVQLKNLKTLQIRSFITKEDGTYRFFELSPDVDYELKADFQGASSGSKTLSSFDSRKKAVINLKLAKK
ncbi:MAG: carboxypeptidase-like regulatory domain-containing protein [Candidatus Solibacter sp.]